MADGLRQRIAAGEFRELLPSERDLGEWFGASRNVVREALGLLRDEGLVERRPGVGTLVVRPKFGHGLHRLAGLAEVLEGYGEVVNEVRAAGVVAAPPSVAERLDLAAGEDVVHVERVRRVGGVPLSLDSTYLVADLGIPLLDHDLSGRDLFALLEESSGTRLGRAEVVVHAVSAGPDTAALLDIPPGTAVFALDRLTRLPDGRPVDAEWVHLRADRLTLQATLHRGAVGDRGAAGDCGAVGDCGAGWSRGAKRDRVAEGDCVAERDRGPEWNRGAGQDCEAESDCRAGRDRGAERDHGPERSREAERHPGAANDCGAE